LLFSLKNLIAAADYRPDLISKGDIHEFIIYQTKTMLAALPKASSAELQYFHLLTLSWLLIPSFTSFFINCSLYSSG
jgi:hypothetical protein